MKSPQMTQVLDVVASAVCGRSRSASLAAGLCVCCGGTAGEFRDGLSEYEYEISGLCQTCQDQVFGREYEAVLDAG